MCRLLQAFLITLRDGFEAFLIVGITLAFLHRRGGGALVSAVYWAVAIAVVTSVVGAWLLSGAESQALWKGVLALAAAVSTAALTVHVWRSARRTIDSAGARPGASARLSGAGPWLALFLLTLLVISRKGMETTLLMGALIFQVGGVDLIAGAMGGLVAAGMVAALWSRRGHRVHGALFFQVTVIFLLLFVVQLAIFGLHELTEANVLPASGRLHEATESYAADGRYGQHLPYLLVLVPLTWLAVAIFWGHGKASDGRVADVGRRREIHRNER